MTTNNHANLMGKKLSTIIIRTLLNWEEKKNPVCKTIQKVHTRSCHIDSDERFNFNYKYQIWPLSRHLIVTTNSNLTDVKT